MALKLGTVTVDTDLTTSIADHLSIGATKQIICMQHRGTAVNMFLSLASGGAQADALVITQNEYFGGPQIGQLLNLKAGSVYPSVAAGTETLIVMYND